MGQKKEVTVIISPDGKTIRFIYDDNLRPLMEAGKVKIERASHVEPTPDGKWTADMSPVDGPLLGPYDTREEALQEEVKWLLDHQIPSPS